MNLKTVEDAYNKAVNEAKKAIAKAEKEPSKTNINVAKLKLSDLETAKLNKTMAKAKVAVNNANKNPTTENLNLAKKMLDDVDIVRKLIG